MTVFVTGATGRVGGTLARTLIARGEKVRTLSLPELSLLSREVKRKLCREVECPVQSR